MTDRRVIDAGGERISLGPRLGGGGEGAVYAISPQTAVKLYAALPDGARIRKIETMVAMTDPTLRRVAAWPHGTLHDDAGRLCGFAMPRIDGRAPLAVAMNPGSRKAVFPHTTWTWLVHVARNLCAVVETLHAAGVVIGDVNESNFLVGDDTFVRAIDVDSYQVSDGRRVYTCDVAVAMYQPPELQGRSFGGVVRTPDHDRFGLATLVFQLIFMGRHPWAGVRSGPEIAFDTGEIIAKLPFAYGRDAAARGFQPPPNSVRMEWLPPACAALFERAFGSPGARPAAGEWVSALAQFESELRPCSNAPGHRFLPSRGACPWCALEKRGIYLFVASPSAPGAPAHVYLDVAELRAMLDAVPVFEPLPLPADPAAIAVQGRPLAPSVKVRRRLWSAALLPAAGTELYGISHLVGGELLALSVGLAFVLSRLRPNLDGERETRLSAARDAEAAFADVAQRWRSACDPAPLRAMRASLEDALRRYRGLPAKFTAERARLESDKYKQQVRDHLERFFIADARIGHVGRKRRETLQAYGIETAFDVEQRLPGTAIPGFSSRALSALYTWSESVKASFVFRPELPVERRLVDELNRREMRERSDLERQLRGGPAALRGLAEKRIAERERLRPEVVARAHALAQARADAAMLRWF